MANEETLNAKRAHCLRREVIIDFVVERRLGELDGLVKSKEMWTNLKAVSTQSGIRDMAAEELEKLDADILEAHSATKYWVRKGLYWHMKTQKVAALPEYDPTVYDPQLGQLFGI